MIAVATLLLATVVAPDTPAGSGRQLYVQYCASCHGVDLRGGSNAPSLRGVGAADVDFWVTTGRMPAAVPWLQVDHRGVQPYLSPSEQNALVQYVASVEPGPAIPSVVTDGDPVRGRALFQQNCMHCHGVNAEGGSIGRAGWAPSLEHATVTQVAEAIRLGPGEMPAFGERQIDQSDLDDIATYLSGRRGADNFGGLPARAGGAVPEGLYGWIAASLLSLFAYGYWLTDRTHVKP